MKGLSLESRIRTMSRPIDAIAQQRMTGRCHMNPNLMRTSGFQTAFQIGETFRPLQDMIMGDSRLAVFLIDAHLLAIRKQDTLMKWQMKVRSTKKTQ